jgi:hypothetical protein
MGSGDADAGTHVPRGPESWGKLHFSPRWVGLQAFRGGNWGLARGVLSIMAGSFTLALFIDLLVRGDADLGSALVLLGISAVLLTFGLMAFFYVARYMPFRIYSNGVTSTIVGTIQGLRRTETLVPFPDISDIEVYLDDKEVVGLKLSYTEDGGKRRTLSIDQSDTYELKRAHATLRDVSQKAFGGRWVDRDGPMRGHSGIILVVSGKNREAGPKPRRGRRKR